MYSINYNGTIKTFLSPQQSDRHLSLSSLILSFKLLLSISLSFYVYWYTQKQISMDSTHQSPFLNPDRIFNFSVSILISVTLVMNQYLRSPIGEGDKIDNELCFFYPPLSMHTNLIPTFNCALSPLITKSSWFL